LLLFNLRKGDDGKSQHDAEDGQGPSPMLHKNVISPITTFIETVHDRRAANAKSNPYPSGTSARF
jgi:hypothetical protein